VLTITRGGTINRRDFFLALNAMQYQRTDIEFRRGRYRVRGDAIEVWPAYERFAVRIELFGDEVERLDLVNPTSGELLAEERQFFLFPAVHHVMARVGAGAHRREDAPGPRRPRARAPLGGPAARGPATPGRTSTTSS